MHWKQSEHNSNFIKTSYGYANDDKVGIITTLNFQYEVALIILTLDEKS